MGSIGRRTGGSYWTVIALCWLLYVFVGAYQIAPASVLPLIADRLSLGAGAVSWVTSVLFLSMAVTAIPIGMALDGVDNRTAILVGSLWLFVATLWSAQAAAAGHYPSLLASRLFGGPALILIWTASVNVTGSLAPADRQATAITLYATSVPLGLAVGQFATPLIAELFGWEFSLPAYGLAALSVAVVFWIDSREWETNVATGRRPSREEFLAVFRHRGVQGIALLGFLTISVMFIINNWMPTYLQDRYQLSLARSGLFAAIFPAIGLFSRASSGLLSDRVFGSRRKPVVALAFLLAAPATIGIVLVDAVVPTLALLVVAGFCSQIGQVLLFVYVRELVPANVVGTALAVLNAMGFFGAFLAPIVTGVLIERSGTYVLTFVGTGAVAGIVAFLVLLIPESDSITSGG
jgi:nitrate/nitrite transporter NarK